MKVIRNHNGDIIQTSRNLRGIREYAGKHAAAKVSCSKLANGGRLCILFDNRSSFETDFASYDILVGFVKRWRNVSCAEISFLG